MKRILITAGLLALSTSVLAADMLPYTFVSGATASADEVNANFNAVANAAEVNATNVEIVANTADDNAAAIAELQSTNAGSSSPALNFSVFDKDLNNLGTLLNHGGKSVTFITDNGFIFNEVDVITGQQQMGGQLYYSGNNCSGNLLVTGQGPSTIFDIGGQLYYVAKDATPVTDNTTTMYVNGTCQSGGFYVPTYYIATPNDPAVTGATVSPVGGAPFTFSK